MAFAALAVEDFGIFFCFCAGCRIASKTQATFFSGCGNRVFIYNCWSLRFITFYVGRRYSSVHWPSECLFLANDSVKNLTPTNSPCLPRARKSVWHQTYFKHLSTTLLWTGFPFRYVFCLKNFFWIDAQNTFTVVRIFPISRWDGKIVSTSN